MTTEPTAPGPVCKSEQGCHRVAPCDPGCGTPWLCAEEAGPEDVLVDAVALLREAATLYDAREQPKSAGQLRALARSLEAGSAPVAPVPPPADRDTLRQHIAEVLWPLTDWDGDRLNAERAADAVLAVLPDPTDWAAVLREAADDLATAFGDPMAKHIGALGASHLRRRAREIEAGQAAEEQPETPLEKRLRYSERRNDELRAECKRRGKRVLEQSEKIIALEREVDEVRRQLGAEILRAGQAEDELRRLAAEAPTTTRPGCIKAGVRYHCLPNGCECMDPAAAGVRQDGAQPCSAALLPFGTAPADRCMVKGKHLEHATAEGRRWTVEEPQP
ncbi:MAG: hypothetical protein HOY75_27370 [Streptomyces sp.]|nr:hypothetical protein [Streptomyces sp.]